ncbi:T9SS type A sorting domain-containing protein [Flavobacterium sp. RHBU_24]|uniref:DUF7619 domain-containing protein n=1 Tax=Flavobacterium sp. RHBU_24 TaxID=3391185 RepID=UPI00398480F9
MLKKLHLIAVTAFCSMAFSSAFGQTIVANDDTFSINGNVGGYINGLRLNDVVNGIPGNQASCNTTILTVLSSGNPGIYLANDCGGITVDPGVQAGAYTLEYQLCLASNPNICDTAVATFNVCSQLPPQFSIVSPTCTAENGVVTFSGLPETGTWTIDLLNSWQTPITTYTGTGTQSTQVIAPGYYNVRVTNAEGCASAIVGMSVNYLQEFDAFLIADVNDIDGSGSISVGDIINLTASITNLLDCPIQNVHAIDGGLNATGSISVLNPGQTDNTSITGTYTITQEDINNGNAGFLWMGITGTYGNGQNAYIKAFVDFSLDIENGMQLIAFLDENNNGVKESSEPVFNGGDFVYTVNGGSNVSLYSGNGEPVIYETNPANLYNLSYQVNNIACAGEYTSATTYTGVTVAALSGITTYYFPISGQECNDVKVFVYGSNAVPGTTTNNYITLYNAGNQVVAAGTLTYTKDPSLSIVSVSSPYANITPTGFTCGYIDLQPGEVRYYNVLLLVPALPGVTLGDTVTATIESTVPDMDIAPENNTASFTTTITGSYDPNDKAEAHGGTIPVESFGADDVLTYMIRFENTGNGPANHVRITDALSNLLDASTVRMVASSHNGSYTLTRNGANLEWNFSIYLPPSTDPESSTGKGYVVFTVKPLPGYAAGTIINNTAEIYFDTNPAIVTNTSSTEFTTTAGTAAFGKNMVTAYPNPVTDVLTLSSTAEIKSVEVYNVLGQLSLSQNVSGNAATINMQGLQNGMYLVKVTGDNGLKTMKVMKE